MIIRSQHKTRIVNMNGIDTICIRSTEDENIVTVDAFNGDSYTLMGEYSTEEKAIKVLDMIQNEYFTHMTVVDNAGVTVKMLERPKVFQMPQDSEV